MVKEYDERFEIQNEEIKSKLRFIGSNIDEQLPEGWGFGLFIFSYGENGAMFWLSSAQREDMIKSLKEWISHQENKDAN